VQSGAAHPVVFLYSVCLSVCLCEFLENPCAERLTFLKGVNVMLLCFLKFHPIWKPFCTWGGTNISRMIVSVIVIEMD